jgi:XTP/dITP diphosphohydrolase
MKELLVATRNKGKLTEIRAILDGLIDHVYSTANFPDLTDTIEDGLSFAENALKKAREAMLFTGLATLADDSGLVVDALNGAPGVFSSRYAGEEGGDAANNRRLLTELAGIPIEKRQCSFVCVMAFVTPEGCENFFSGQITGKVLLQERGTGGFGYDPLILVDGFDKTMAELSLVEKNRISHRGEALRQFRNYLASTPYFKE